MLFSLLALCLSISAWSHQTSLSTGGRELFWANPTVSMVVRTNTSDLSSASVNSIIAASMSEWNVSSTAKINAVGSSANEIKFQSNYPFGSGVIGVTELSYNSSGVIQRATILLNDDYTFHSTPGIYPLGQVYLGDVVSHEIGHVFGLSHSEVLDSTMFYSSFSGQSSLAYDDQTGIRQKYSSSSYGKITGVVKGGNHVGVLGAHVQAISGRTGKASAAVTDQNGNFVLGGLDINDTYYLYTSPIKNSNSLPGYFSNTQDEFCPAAYKGSFFSECGSENNGKPQGVPLSASHPSIDVGTVTINCALKSDRDYNEEKEDSTFSPLNIFTYDPHTPNHTEQAFVGWFRNASTSSWSTADVFGLDLSQVVDGSKYVKLSLVSYPFGTQLDYEVSVVNNAGQSFASAERSLVYSSSTQTYSTDYETFLPLSSSGGVYNQFEVRIRSKKLGTSVTAATFPSASTFTSGTYLPYLVVATIWENTASGLKPMVSEADLSDNESCLDAPFTYAVASTRASSSDDAISADTAAAAAGCGTIEPPKNGPGSSLPLVALGFLMALSASALVKSRKKFLS